MARRAAFSITQYPGLLAPQSEILNSTRAMSQPPRPTEITVQTARCDTSRCATCNALVDYSPRAQGHGKPP